jgi:MraZ protein
VFLGTFVPRLDEKGRLILPARFREEVVRVDGTERLVIAKGQRRCLTAWPARVFARAADAVAAGSRGGIGAAGSSAAPLEARDYLRVLYAGAVEQEFDKQGRITLSAQLRQYAGLTQQVAVIGADTYFELWDAGAWDRYLEEMEPRFAAFPEAVLAAGPAAQETQLEPQHRQQHQQQRQQSWNREEPPPPPQ